MNSTNSPQVNFHIVTIFPEAIESYFNSSILKRAMEKKLIKINLVDLKKFSEGKRGVLDDRMFGGGPGMVMKVEPIVKAVNSILNSKFQATKIKQIKNPRIKILITAPAGKRFTQTVAKNYQKKFTDIVIICGRYEGIDARVKNALKDLLKNKFGAGRNYGVEEISIGDYVLTGGELPAAIIVDAISRHVDGVLGKKESLEDERGVGIPVYTRPEILKLKIPRFNLGKTYKVPKVLLSGNHAKIEEWKQKHKRIDF